MPYKVLATSTKHGEIDEIDCVRLVNQHTHFKAKTGLTPLVLGFMQFVQSVPVAEVLATEGNIQVWRNYFRLIFWHFSSTLLMHSWPATLINHCSDRASFGSTRPVKKGPTVSARR